jgi:hypothetical protein
LLAIGRRARSNGCFLKPNALSARLASWKCLDGNLDWMSQAMLEMMNPKNPLFGKPVPQQDTVPMDDLPGAGSR